jgi:hypothetical protein
MFSWVQTHKEITQWLFDKEDQQDLLIQTLKDIGVNGGLKDKYEYKGEADFDLQVIDPFTFFACIYKHGPKNNLKILQELAKHISITVPNDIDGVPSSNPQNAWYFAYAYDRGDDDITILWKLFQGAVIGEVSPEMYNQADTVKWTGNKLLDGLFWVNPESYLPINNKMKEYLKIEYGIESKTNNFEEYTSLLDEIKRKSGKKFYEISHDAKLKERQADSTKESKIRYWLYAPGEGARKWEDFYNRGLMPCMP